MVLSNIMKPPEVLQIVDPDGQARGMFDELTRDAIKVHARKRSLIKHFEAGNRRMEFSIEDAAREAIRRSKMPPPEIWSSLMKITSIIPADVSDTLSFHGGTWDELAAKVSCDILWREIYLLHPEVLDEDARREEYWAARTKK